MPDTIRSIVSYFALREVWFEVIVSDDGSTDGTAEVARDVLRPLGDRGTVLQNRRNCGKGAAVRRGMLAARGQVALLTDADLATPIDEIAQLLAAIAAGADVAIGSRALDRRLIERAQPVLRDRLGRLFNVVAQAFVVRGFWDTQCGFKLFRSEPAAAIFSRQRIDGFGFDVEVVALALHLGFQVAEVPVRWSHQADSRVTLRAGAAAFLDPLRVRAGLLTGRYGPRIPPHRARFLPSLAPPPRDEHREDIQDETLQDQPL